jgi:hypothetical protein
VHALQAVPQHRAVDLVEHLRVDLDPQVGSDAEDVAS